MGWQLRILVLGSQAVQWLLFFSSRRRKSGISASFRVLIWLAYLGGDAMVIYALAALLNRPKNHYANPTFPHGNSVLEAVWAPVLLMHLGGQYSITACNMVDNELWGRHALIAVSQITVSIYVFCKAWSGGDRKLLQAAIILFTLGGLKCLEKPFALRKASNNGLVSSSDTTVKLSDNSGSSAKIHPLGEYVRKVQALYQAAEHEGDVEAKRLPGQAQGEGDVEANRLPGQAQGEGDVEANRLPGQAQGEGDVEANGLPGQAQGEGDVEASRLPGQAQREVDVEANGLPGQAQGEGDVEANRLADQSQGEVDVEANSLPDKAKGEVDVELNSLPDQAQGEVDIEANSLPEKAQGEGNARGDETDLFSGEKGKDQVNNLFVDLASPYGDRLSVTKSFLKLDGKKAYELLQERLSDTFDLFFTKAKMVPDNEEEFLVQTFRFACRILPFVAIGLFHRSHREAYDDNDVKVTYTLLCCTAVMELFSFAPFADGSKLSGTVAQYSFMEFFATTRVSMKRVNKSSKITMLVHQQVKGWWKDNIRDAADYARFNNHRGQWAIQKAGCGRLLGWSIKRSFDESVLLWHIATDLCFHNMGVRSNYVAAEGCREISNYMMYLLFAKPEMLMAGTRRNLLNTAYGELNRMLGSRDQPIVDGRALAQILVVKVEESPNGGYFVHQACKLAKKLSSLDDQKMWEVIQGVWVEMLCYSSSRCRGYLHAQSLGTGGELLTFLWLQWSHMGMETLAERMQMPDLEQMPDEELPSEEEMVAMSS